MPSPSTSERVALILTLMCSSVIFAHSALASEPIIDQLSARRVESGAVVIGGRANHLPAGTKLAIEILRQGGREIFRQDRIPDDWATFAPELKGKLQKSHYREDDIIVGDDGHFETRPLTMQSGAIWSPGKYRVQIESHFSKAWQSCDVIKQLGVDTDSQCRTSIDPNPTKLPASPELVPADPEFPNAGRYLKAPREVAFPALSEDSAVIDTVKNARLTVQGKGRSADPIRNVVAYFEKGSSGAFTPRAWSAKRSSPSGPWVVTLDCVDGEERKQAQWEYDPKTKTVKYLDPLAKTLSWLPRD